MKQEVRCDCGHFFQVVEAAAGGYVNCPRCEKAVRVPGLRDPLWRFVQVIGVVLWCVVTYAALLTWNVAAALLVGIASGLVLWLFARSF